MFNFTNVREFNDGLASWIKEADKLITEVYRGIAVEAFFEVLDRTPQWSGNAVSNWNFSVDSVDTSITYELAEEEESADFDVVRSFVGESLRSKGDTEAIGFAIGRNRGRAKQVASYLHPIFISNSVKSLDGDSYIRMLEDNPGNFLREVNEPGHMVEDTVAILTKAGKISNQRIEDLRIMGNRL